MAQYTTDDGTAIWSHPDLKSVGGVIDLDDAYEYECPNEDGCSGEYMLNLDTEADVDDMVSEIEKARNNGTLRCGSCDEPLYGVVGDGDYGDGFARSGWKAGWS